MKTLCIGFRGKYNASSVLASSMGCEFLLLTNSFAGLKRDLDSINDCYDSVYMFGIDKHLKDHVRIEPMAEVNGDIRLTSINVEELSTQFSVAGLNNVIATSATYYLCNEAYWHALDKFGGKAVFIHVPPIRYIDSEFIDKMKLITRQ